MESEKSQGIFRSGQSKLAAVAYLLLILVSVGIDIASKQKESPGSYVLKYIVLVLYALFQVYILDCLVHGNCTLYAWFVATVTFVLALLTLFAPYIFSTQSQQPERV